MNLITPPKTALFVFFALFSMMQAYAGPKAAESNRYSDIEYLLNENDSIAIYPPAYDFQAIQNELDVIEESVKNGLEKIGLKGDFINASESDFKALQFLSFARYEQERKKEIRTAFIDSLPKGKVHKLIVFSSVVQREAMLRGKIAKWDGMKHLQIMKGYSGAPGVSVLSGSTMGLSLKHDVYTPKGEWLYSAYSGISVPYYFDMKKGGDGFLKEELFGSKKDKKYLKKSMDVILHPLKKRYMN